MKKHSLKFLLKLISKGFPKFKLKDPKVGSFLSNIASGRPSPKQTKSSPFLRKSSDVSVCQKKKSCSKFEYMIKMLKVIEINNTAQKQPSIIKFSEKFALETGKKKMLNL